MKYDVRFFLAAGLAMGLSASIARADSLPSLYTAAQASAGEAVFVQNCAMCHGADLKGQIGPALIGQNFAAASNKYTLGALFTEVAQKMPATNPGGLTHDQYTQVFSYILSKNGYPAGTTPLAYQTSLTSPVPLVSQVP